MKKLILTVIIGMMVLISCSNPSSPTKVISKKEYSILFNAVHQILGESYALGVINPD
jgi:hypothetical protein